MSLDYQIILIACTGVIALYSLLVLIFGPVRTRGYKKYHSLLKDEKLYNTTENKFIETVWKRDKKKLSNLKGFETAAFIIDLLFSLGCCALLILYQIGRLDKELLSKIIYAGFGFVLIAFIFQFAYIWLLGSIFYRHFYDAKYKYDHYNKTIPKTEALTNLTDIYHGTIKTSKLMATSLPFAILFLLIIAATGYFYYKYYEENFLSLETKRNRDRNENENEKQNQNQDQNQKISNKQIENNNNNNHSKSNSNEVTGNVDEKSKNDDIMGNVDENPQNDDANESDI